MNNSTLPWKSKRKFYFLAILQYIIYLALGLFVCWFCWFVLLKESLWYGFFAFGSLYYVFELHRALNFKSIILTEQGLILKMRWFDTEIFYPYGSFTMSYDIAYGIRFFERIEIQNIKHIRKEFIFPCGVDSFGSFENNHTFKELCTKYTQKALETMNLEEKVNLYKLYRANIKIFFNQEIDHNVFIIDFSPYIQEIKTYLKDKNEPNKQ
ncbi:TPA: hypothetical protein SB588_001731 [Campylobacter coli]|uniref:hypothetical protein n=2 Tax=Campylobacter coli TaxID=195 RepID=UPI000930FCA0|nr:hypothetical protein [Campylobacter coli]HEB7537195.1 hypothetical protein [Campylobacter coli]HEG0589984.1 hypothetical protein [Campylobacter coli]HEG0609953.1 hypothetical protein [Campylobacter coli]